MESIRFLPGGIESVASNPHWRALLNPQEMVTLGVVEIPQPSCVSGNSIDLCIKEVYEITEGIIIHTDGSRQLPYYSPVNPVHETLHLDMSPRYYWEFQAGTLYQVEFKERVHLPSDIAALTVMRSSFSKSGVTGEIALFDSGYSGPTGMSVSVKFTSYVEVGGAIAQMLFLRTNSSKDYDGYYRNPNWLNKDHK